MAGEKNHAMTISPFLTPFAQSSAQSLAILHLSRDLQTPVQLKLPNQSDSVAEAKTTTDVENPREFIVTTRFGSFPYSTLVNLPWGSPVLASKVDTGSWGKNKRKRKRDEGQGQQNPVLDQRKDTDDPDRNRNDKLQQQKPLITAETGFAHLIPPTPEVWTRALRHRTQVVYTPDYSYILQRLRVRPGTCVIEAGAGSGSFTHAAARAVFNGYPPAPDQQSVVSGHSNEELDDTAVRVTTPTERRQRKRYGRVYSFEFHEPRVRALGKEIKDHGLQSIVQLTHRDVYEEGFSIQDPSTKSASPDADAIFLDLPAPWLAVKHLTRDGGPEASEPPKNSLGPEQQTANKEASIAGKTTSPTSKPASPLNPLTTTRLCTFSPCIEQAQRTITALRTLGWVEIEMVELAQRRIEVRRERVGIHEEGLRGVNAHAASVDEAVARLREIEARQRAFHLAQQQQAEGKAGAEEKGVMMSKAERLKRIREAEAGRKTFKEGRLVHRTEPELKTHTSYLVFALLPRRWTEEDEERCRRKWVVADTEPQGKAAKKS